MELWSCGAVELCGFKIPSVVGFRDCPRGPSQLVVALNSITPPPLSPPLSPPLPAAAAAVAVSPSIASFSRGFLWLLQQHSLLL